MLETDHPYSIFFSPILFSISTSAYQNFHLSFSHLSLIVIYIHSQNWQTMERILNRNQNHYRFKENVISFRFTNMSLFLLTSGFFKIVFQTAAWEWLPSDSRTGLPSRFWGAVLVRLGTYTDLQTHTLMLTLWREIWHRKFSNLDQLCQKLKIKLH